MADLEAMAVGLQSAIGDMVGDFEMVDDEVCIKLQSLDLFTQIIGDLALYVDGIRTLHPECDIPNPDQLLSQMRLKALCERLRCGENVAENDYASEAGECDLF